MARAPIPAELEDVQDEDEVLPDDQGQDGEGGEGEASEDAALDPGEEQETGPEALVDDQLPIREPRIQRLARENSELKRRLSDVERRTAPQAPVIQRPQEESEEQFRARIQLLPPDERMEARYERSERRNQAQLNAMHVQQTLTADKIAFDATVAANPRRARYAAEVEAKHAEMLQQGQMIPREALYFWLLGQKVDGFSGTKEVRQQRRQGAQRVQSQQTRPAGGRSDVRGDGRRPANEADARAKRLAGLQI